MSAEFDLRLAWQAHRDGDFVRRDALLTLAVASAQPKGSLWVETARDFLVKAHPGHLFDGFYHLDEALADRRVIAAIKRLRFSFPETRVRHMLHRAEVAKGPYTGRQAPIAVLLQELFAPPKTTKVSGPRRLGTASIEAAFPPAPEIPSDEPADSILSFYLNVLLGVATLCHLVLEASQDDKRAA